MSCKRGHSDWHKTKFVGKKRLVCDFIIAYRMKEGLGSSALLCGELALSKKIPKGWSQV